jgi:non-heme chloroperoxidase
VAIDPAPFRGVLPLPISALKGIFGRARESWDPRARCTAHVRAVPVRVCERGERARSPGAVRDVRGTGIRCAAFPGRGTANLNPWTEAKVKSKNPNRGPLLIIDGEKDNTVPWAIANASYKKQRRNKGVTEIVKIPNRGHSLTIDGGWHEVAETSLTFVRRFVKP